MGLYQRGDSWWVDLTTPNGKRIRESAKTTDKKLALKFEAKMKREMFELHQLGILPDRPLKDAVDHFLKLKRREGLRSVQDYERQLNWWIEQFDDVSLQRIDDAQIVDVILKKSETVTRLGEVPSNATLNRYLAALRACLNAAYNAKWISRVPRFVEYDEPKERVRWLSTDERNRLLEACPQHWRGMVRMALATGLRQSNVRDMRWEWVDVEARTLTVPGADFKNGREFCIPLNGEAMAVLKEHQGQSSEFVFTYRGKPITQLNHDAWKAVLMRAGIENFRWHDLRHTWATDMARRGVPTQALQKLGGWETLSMVGKYAHHDVESLRQFVDAEPTSQIRHTPEPGPKPGLRLVA